jgi:hypothetical protein
MTWHKERGIPRSLLITMNMPTWEGVAVVASQPPLGLIKKVLIFF